MARTLMARELGATWPSRLSYMLHIHTCGHICTYQASYGQERGILYYVAMKYDIRPRSRQKEFAGSRREQGNQADLA